MENAFVDNVPTCESCKHLRLRLPSDKKVHQQYANVRFWCAKLNIPTTPTACRCDGDDHVPKPIIGKTLKDVLPREFMTSSFESSLARKYANELVICQHDARVLPWPDIIYKNVTYWWELANGYAVGFNENPARGWAFPICRIN